MLLNVVTPERRLAHSPAGDMTLVAGLFVVALTYLDVPFWNALLFGPAITLQAAVGVVVLTRLLKGVPGSLLLLLGPGLILGGALSFAIFQLVGRGALGLVVVVAVGIGAVAILTSSTTWQPLSASRMWTLGQILGLAALALTWEFPELLPVAAAFFILGFFAGDSPTVPSWLAWTVGALGFVAIALVPILRQDYWWLITDDYKFFEVLSFHITKSGPLADWGVGNFGKYHWLSYGWTGLLNVLGGNPEIFTTSTRVMPLVYSTALAASLFLITSTLRQKIERVTLVLIPVWGVLAINRLDWSGLSSAGVYAVIAATAATTVLAHNSNQIFARRIFLYFCFGLIVGLTKLPSVFATALVVLVFEASILTKHFQLRYRIPLLFGTALAGSLATLPLVLVLGNFIENFQVVTINPGLGQLAEFGPRFALFALLAKNLIIVVSTTVAVGLALRNYRATPTARWSDALLGLALFQIVGLVLDVKVHGNANAHEYFSGPMYFVASLAIILSSSATVNGALIIRTTKGAVLAATGLSLAGLLWTRMNLNEVLWSFLGLRLLNWNERKVILVQYFTAGMVNGAATAALILLPLLVIFGRRSVRLLQLGLLTSVIFLTLYAYSESASSEISRIRNPEELASYLGSPNAQNIGMWVKSNTDDEQLVATNYLYDHETGRPLSDFSLAAWAQREFLVLGPIFLPDFDSHISDVEASIQFGLAPSAASARDLTRRGVNWFIVDKWNTSFTDWRRDWDVKYENDRFLVVKL